MESSTGAQTTSTATLLKVTLPSSHQLPIVSQVWVESRKPLPIDDGNFDWFDHHSCYHLILKCHVVREDSISQSCFPSSGSYILSAPSSGKFPEPWGWGVRCSCLIECIQSHLFSALWATMCLCLNHHPLQEETSLAKVGSSINLWIEIWLFRRRFDNITI